ncbi:tumor necrosis factor receptor superfamily member 1A isoform X2 [Xiphias gladius]|uniref:tumor necrosis factor receptor superfamily member 1A isoform X2 n=1 Tax=Xiphias gladius TaxID=8245 RepID=UPI001A9A07F1|nr:tumor necrosis factor receptor superfamily member 1A isoform X2 [Xiphias gladius]
MEETGHRGRWNKKSSVGTILLLMYMFIPALALLQPSEEQICPHGDYPTEKGICCNKCSPGFKLVEKCHATGQRSICTPCPDGQFTDQMNFFPNCRRCTRCKTSKHEFEVSPCERNKNTICQCKEGYYKSHIDSETYECLKCTQCGPDEKEKQNCAPEKNTVCVCNENYYRVNSKCVPCKNCTAECDQHCSTPPGIIKVHNTGNELLIKIIGVVAAVALVLLVLVVLITYMATKWFTKKKLLKPTSQPSDVSPDSSEVLIYSEEPFVNSNVKAIPQSPVSEQQPSNLPDCVPLEINSEFPDLIYTVLDLVPVLQVKQLVRTLGVKDTDIEQAEMDHRSCREAHYQMLRVWVERGSRAGGGGRGRMLHSPLLQELLDKLKDMHLGQAAEELETKYGIQ